jgi:hypothetical protein
MKTPGSQGSTGGQLWRGIVKPFKVLVQLVRGYQSLQGLRGEAQAPQATGELEECVREPPPGAGGACGAAHRLVTAGSDVYVCAR